ncbi:TolC family outer membrane protein [Rhizorhabdus argentea]|uniref:TolC family outer membrane protein n=1 Tax=Rhizorhabdus argentea TaxID=1387174 RepID=UPI0030EF87F8
MIFDIVSIDNKLGRQGHPFALMFGAAFLLHAAVPASAETLMDAVEAAYGNNPTLVAQRYRQKSTNENYVQTRAQYGPTVSLQAAGTYDYEKLYRRPSADGYIGDLTLNVRQPIYSGGRQRGALAQARANVRSSEEGLRRIEGEVIDDVINAYAAVLRDQQRLEVARQNVAVLNQQLEERRAKRRVRDVTVTDVAQADSRLAAGEAQLANLEAQLAVSRGEYLRIVGHEPGELQPLPELPGLPESIDEAFAIAEGENAELTSARFAEEAARANVATQRGGQRPTASITADAGKVRGVLSPFDRHSFRTQVTAQVTITQPLFQGGAIRSRIRQAQDQNNVAQAVVDGTRRQAFQDVVLAWNQLASTRVGVTAGSRQVQAAQIAFAGMEREERYGLRSTIETLNAEQELASAQLGLLSNRYQEYVARASLLLAMGRLDARTVNSAIPARDPEAEFKKVRWRGISPTEPVAMLLDHVGSASPYAKPKPDLRGSKQPKPTGSPAMPATLDKSYTQKPLVPITQSPLVPADQLPSIVGDYGTSPQTDDRR